MLKMRCAMNSSVHRQNDVSLYKICTIEFRWNNLKTDAAVWSKIKKREQQRENEINKMNVCKWIESIKKKRTEEIHYWEKHFSENRLTRISDAFRTQCDPIEKEHQRHSIDAKFEWWSVKCLQTKQIKGNERTKMCHNKWKNDFLKRKFHKFKSNLVSAK